MRLSDSFDVPGEILEREHSPAMREFLWNWFGDTYKLTRGEVDLSFLDELSDEELTTARDLIRRNLNLRYNHIIQGAAALGDLRSVAMLRSMLETEEDLSRRLTISGALWNLVRDPAFLDCLNEAKRRGGVLACGHLCQVLWLDNESAVDLLIDLLDDKDAFVRFQAHSLLAELQLGVRRVVQPSEMPHTADEYRRLRSDQRFRAQMLASIRKRNRDVRSGTAFGFREAHD